MELSIEKLKEAIKYLEENPEVVFDPYPEYDSKIYDILYSLGTDAEYSSNYEKIEDKDISALTLDELKTMFTFIARGERFCDGHIARYVEDGTLLLLAKRELELINASFSDR